jgi:hypothetical protein
VHRHPGADAGAHSLSRAMPARMGARCAAIPPRLTAPRSFRR